MNEILNTAKEISKDISETMKQRLFSPMYFYFIIAWFITNWQFVYVYFFLDEEVLFKVQGVIKVDYLNSLYPISTVPEFIFMLLRLLIVPAFSAWFAMWVLPLGAVLFYRKNYQNKKEEERTVRLVDYDLEQKEKKEKEKRRVESKEANKVLYENQTTFNEEYDNTNDTIDVLGIDYSASEALYRIDYDRYVEVLYEYRDQNPDYREGIFSK